MVKKVITHECETPKGPLIKEISANTQIVLTMQNLIITVITLLGVFYGFYQIVVVPKVEATEKHYSKMYDDQKEQNNIFYQELVKLNTSIGSLDASLNALTSNGKNVQASQNALNSSTRSSFRGTLPTVSMPDNQSTALNLND